MIDPTVSMIGADAQAHADFEYEAYAQIEDDLDTVDEFCRDHLKMHH